MAIEKTTIEKLEIINKLLTEKFKVLSCSFVKEKTIPGILYIQYTENMKTELSEKYFDAFIIQLQNNESPI